MSCVSDAYQRPDVVVVAALRDDLRVEEPQLRAEEHFLDAHDVRRPHQAAERSHEAPGPRLAEVVQARGFPVGALESQLDFAVREHHDALGRLACVTRAYPCGRGAGGGRCGPGP